MRSQREKWGRVAACLLRNGAYSPPPLQAVSVSVSEKVPRAGAEQLGGGSTREAKKRLAAPWTPFPVGFCSEPNCTRGERSPLRVKRQRPSEGLQESQEISGRG